MRVYLMHCLGKILGISFKVGDVPYGSLQNTTERCGPTEQSWSGETIPRNCGYDVPYCNGKPFKGNL